MWRILLSFSPLTTAETQQKKSGNFMGNSFHFFVFDDHLQILFVSFPWGIPPIENTKSSSFPRPSDIRKYPNCLKRVFFPFSPSIKLQLIFSNLCIPVEVSNVWIKVKASFQMAHIKKKENDLQTARKIDCFSFALPHFFFFFFLLPFALGPNRF